jgi:hypothetical protein
MLIRAEWRRGDRNVAWREPSQDLPICRWTIY